MAIGPHRRVLDPPITTDVIPTQVRLQRARDRAKALGLRVKPVGGSQLVMLSSTKKAVVPVGSTGPMTLDEAEHELTMLAHEYGGGC